MATSAMVPASERASASAAPKPSVWSPMKRQSSRPCAASQASSPFHSAASVPGESARCRSAPSHVAVRRGSMTTTRTPRSARASWMRW